MAFRFDSGTIHQSEKTPEGFLRVYAHVSKIGPLSYLRADGKTHIEHVTEAELFNEDSLETASMKPITFHHPPGGLVTPENATQYQKGFTGSQIIKNLPYATLIATITDRTTIDAIESGQATQVSAGYRCSTRQRSDGAFEQTSRQYNHFAIVPLGRAGADVCLHLDSEDDIAVFVNDSTTQKDKKSMPRQLTIGGEIFSVDDDALADAILRLMQDEEDELPEPIRSMGYSGYQDAIDGLKTKLDTSEGNVVGLQSRVDSLTTELQADQATRLDADAIATEVASRADTWSLVLPVLRMDDPEFKPDYKLPVADVQKLAIAKKLPNLALDGRSDEFVQGIWATLEPEFSKPEQRQDSSDQLHGWVQQAQRQDAGDMGTGGKSSVAMKRKERSKLPVK